jgi:hypothetical protein
MPYADGSAFTVRLAGLDNASIALDESGGGGLAKEGADSGVGAVWRVTVVGRPDAVEEVVGGKAIVGGGKVGQGGPSPLAPSH